MTSLDIETPHGAICKATAKSTGVRCKQWAVRGATVCIRHGGAAPQVKAAAARRLAAQAATKAVHTLGLPLDISPTEALLEEVRWTAGHVAWLRARVQELDTTGEARELTWGITRVKSGGDDYDTTEESKPSVWYDLYARERDRLVRVCEAAIKAGVEERRVRLAERQGDLLALAITRILDAFGLAGDPRVATIVPTVLREIGMGA